MSWDNATLPVTHVVVPPPQQPLPGSSVVLPGGDRGRPVSPSQKFIDVLKELPSTEDELISNESPKRRRKDRKSYWEQHKALYLEELTDLVDLLNNEEDLASDEWDAALELIGILSSKLRNNFDQNE